MSADINAIDLDGQEGALMSGVFRWKQAHTLRSLPLPKSEYLAAKMDYTKGWMDLLRSRYSNDAQFKEVVAFVQQDLCLIDCLSFPCSIVSALVKSGILKLNEPKKNRASDREIMEDLHIVCLGCSAKAEERILRETSCWGEIGLALRATARQVHLYLVGPEMSCSQANVPTAVPVEFNMTCHTFRGTAGAFFKANKDLLPLPVLSTSTGLTQRSVNTVAVGLNCGFGNFENPGLTKYDLLLSWYSDLLFLVSVQHLPIIFTCANDYADIDGECYLHANFLGSKFLCEPQRNPFCCASTFISGAAAGGGESASSSRGRGGGGDRGEQSDFSCGNSFWYCVQGSDPLRKRRFANGTFKLPVSASSPAKQRHDFMHTLLNRGGGGEGERGVPLDVCMGSATLPWLMVGQACITGVGTSAPAPTAGPQMPELDVGEPELREAGAEAEAEKRAELQKEEGASELSTMAGQKALQVEDSVPSNAVDVCIQQTLESTAGLLTVSLSVPGSDPLPELSALELHVDVSGVLLLVEGFAWAGEQNGSCRVALQCPVKPASVTAKVSKKKRSLVVVASVV